MKETSWKDCLYTNTSRKITKDTQRARSLRETAKERIEQSPLVTEKNCNFVFEDYYTSILEVLQAHCYEQGFAVMNHVCMGFYLRDVLEKEKLFLLFDDLRYKRNSLTYYGKRMEYSIAKDTIKNSKQLLDELEKLK